MAIEFTVHGRAIAQIELSLAEELTWVRFGERSHEGRFSASLMEVVAAIDEALEFAAMEAEKVAACNHEPDEADECLTGCHHSGAAAVATAIRALKCEKPPNA